MMYMDDLDKNPNDRLVWVDTETSGLNPQTSVLLEVAGIVTDTGLEQIGEPFHATVRYSPDEVEAIRAKSDPFVQKMHDENGIWDSLPAGYGTVDEVDSAFLAWLLPLCPERRQGRIAGNSIRLDMNFMDAYMPQSMNHLHYRSVDVTGIHFMLNHWLDLTDVPGTTSDHTALADITNSLNELRFLRQKMGELR